MIRILITLFGLSFLFVASAYADGYTIYPPGKMPTQVVPNMGGGATIYPPGEMPRQVVPNMGGGATIYTPGEMPTTVTPRW